MKFPRPLLVFFSVSVAVAGFFAAVFSTDIIKAAVYSVNDFDSVGFSSITQTSVYVSWTVSQINGGSQDIYRNGAYITTVGVGTSGYSSTGLSCGTTYTFQICSAYGCASNSVVTTACAPAAPTGFTATPVSQTQNNLSWTASGGATGYYVYRNGGYIGATSATSYSDAGLACVGGGSYYAVAYNAGGSSAASNSASASTDQCTPGAPTIGTASTIDQTTASVAWTRGSPYTESGFNIYSSGGPYRGSAGAGATSGTASGLTANTPYAFNVEAYVTTNGRTYYSSRSANSNVITTLPNPPATPTGFTATSISSSEINLSWNAVSGATSYTVYRQGLTPALYSGSATSVSDALLSPNTLYNYTVLASNTGGSSANASASNYTRPNAPSLSGSPNSTTTIFLSYSYDAGTTYSLYRGATLLAQGASATGYLDQGLTCGTSYSYSISTVNSGGSSATTNGTYSTVVCAPAAPSGLYGTSTETQINLSWNDNSTNESGFRVYRDGVLVGTVGANITSFIHGGLTCSTTTGSYTVRAYNAGGESGDSVSFSTLTSLCVPALTSPANASWVSSRNFCAWVTGYPGVSTRARFVIGGVLAGNGGYAIGSGSSCYTHTSDLNGTSWYAYTEDSALRTSASSSPWTAYVDTTAPTPNPPTVSASAASQTSLNVSMSAGTDSASGLHAAAYGFSTNGSTYTWYASNSQIISGLTASTLYTVYGKIRDAVGNETSAGTTSATTLPNPPSAPTGLSATTISQTQIDLSWTAASGATGYYVYRGGAYIGSSGATSYSDTGLSCGTSYSYQVTAYNTGGASASSTASSATTSACDTTPPSISRTGSGTNWMTSATTSATASDVSSGISYVRHCWADTQTMPPCDPGTTAASTFTNGATLTQTTSGSSWYACFRASDTAGNWTPALTLGNYASYCWGPVRVDTTIPTPNPPIVSASAASQTSVNTSMSAGTDSYSGLNTSPYGYSTNGSTYTWYSTPSQTLSGLACGTSYTVYGKIRDATENMTSAGTAGVTTASCVSAPASAPAATTTADPGRPEATVSTATVTSDGYYIVRCSANSTACVKVYEGTGSGSYTVTGFSCPASYKLYRYAYNVDSTVVGRDVSCDDMNTKLTAEVPSTDTSYLNQKKCSPYTVQDLDIKYCTRGFLVD